MLGDGGDGHGLGSGRGWRRGGLEGRLVGEEDGNNAMIRRDGGEVRVRGRRNGSGHDRRQRTMVRHRRSTKDEKGKQSTFLSRLASSRLVLTTSMAVALGAPTPALPQNEYFNLVKVAPSPLVPRSSPQVLLNQRQRHIFTLATFAAYLSLLTLVFDPTALPGQSDP